MEVYKVLEKLRTPSFYLLLSIVAVCFTCTVVRDNPLDEKGSNYHPPEISIDTSQSSISDSAVIHFNSGTISFTKGRYEQQYRYRFTDGEWNDWFSDNTISLSDLSDGNHVISIETRYLKGENSVEKKIHFTVETDGYKPFFAEKNNDTISAEVDSSVRITLSLSGKEPFSCQWYKSDSLIEDQSELTFVILEFSTDDTGTYCCIVQNSYGIDTSRNFVLQVTKTLPEEQHHVYYAPNGADGGTVPTDDRAYKAGEAFTTLPNTGDLTKDGYVFAGWSTNRDNSDGNFSSGTELKMDTADMVLYAWWTDEPVYSVTYNKNNATSGNAPTDNNNYIAGATVTVRGNSGNLENSDSVFLGWTKDPSEESYYRPGDTVIIGSEDLILYASWGTVTHYQVIYHADSADDGDVPIDDNHYLSGDVAILPDNSGELSRTDHTLIGWSSASDESGKKYASGDTVIVTADIDFYALWTANPTYSITYDDNESDEGSVPVDDNHYLPGDSATAKPNSGTLSKDGYSFVGWNSNADGSGTDYLPQQKLEMPEQNITLFAKWTSQPTFNVIYHPNESTSGDVPVDVNSYTEGQTVTVFHPGMLVKEGYSFNGWNTEQGGSGNTFQPETTFAMSTNDIDLYAQWTINHYTVSFDTRNGTAIAAVTVDHGNRITRPDDPVRTGFYFSGWYGDQNFSETWDFTSAAVTGDCTLYAAWTRNSYTVSFDPQGGAPVPVQTVSHGDTAEVPATPIRTGHTFDGWFTEEECENRWDFSTDVITSDELLYAGWSIETYTVTFDTREGSDIASVPVEYNATVSEPENGPTRTGFTFRGWYKDATGDNEWDFESAITSDTTIYAFWTITTYEVVFNTQDGSHIPPVQVNHGDAVAEPDAPTRSHYTFLGWYEDADGENEWNFSTEITADDTLFALWTLNSYEITFNTQGGNTIPSRTIGYGQMVTQPDDPTRTGYTFVDWFEDTGGANRWDFESHYITAPDTIYATWEINSYPVTFESNGGNGVPSQTANYNSTVSEPSNPTRSGYLFRGWFTDPSHTVQWNFTTDRVTDTLKLYALWEACSYILPEIGSLTENQYLPDPFTFIGGAEMTRRDEWDCRRTEILAMAGKYIYGEMPPEPDSTSGAVRNDEISFTCYVNQNSVDFSFAISSGTGDVLVINFGAGVHGPENSKTLSFNPASSLAPVKELFPAADIGTLISNAWTVDRIIDVLEMHPECGIAANKIMVTGCSMNGRHAFVTGAYCDRIALTVPVESGVLAGKSWRMAEWFRHGGGQDVLECSDDDPQGIDNIEDTYNWLGTTADWVRFEPSNVNFLPFDQHLLMACIAPRACCYITNQHGRNEWCALGATCEALSAYAAEPVWNALGVSEYFGFLMFTEASAPMHCGMPNSALQAVNEFYKRVFEGDTNAATDFMLFGTGDNDLQQPVEEWQPMWIDWNMEKVLQ